MGTTGVATGGAAAEVVAEGGVAAGRSVEGLLVREIEESTRG
jgi:hypothetical protein